MRLGSHKLTYNAGPAATMPARETGETAARLYRAAKTIAPLLQGNAESSVANRSEFELMGPYHPPGEGMVTNKCNHKPGGGSYGRNEQRSKNLVEH